MTPDLLRETGEALYGPRWQSELAHALDMSSRHMRRLAAGTTPLRKGIIMGLLRLCQEHAKTLDDLAEQLMEQP